MDVGIEQKISSLIATQFPAFYRDDGPLFVQFVKAYYEWMEQETNVINRSRNILNYRDIDVTPEQFLIHFQKKYLYGIPFDVIINKRLLLKHVLDAYRSKGSIQCYQLLFRLIYNEDVSIYLPGIDILRLSDGTWKQLKYLELTFTNNATDLIGKTIQGIFSKTTATVESYITEIVNNTTITTLMISNINPKNGDFIKGEKVIDLQLVNSSNVAQIISAAPSIIGSLQRLEILNGSQKFKPGTILKAASRDVTTGEINSFGRDASIVVKTVGPGKGGLSFSLINGGAVYRLDPLTFVYNGDGDVTGFGASFDTNYITNAQTYLYNTDAVYDYFTVSLDDTTFNFPLDPTANLSSDINSALTFDIDEFGAISTLTRIRTGQQYTKTARTFVKEVYLSNQLQGNIQYSANTTEIVGDGTSFTDYFSNNDVIWMQADSTIPETAEYQVIKQVTNATSIELYGYPTYDSTASAIFKFAPEIINSNYVLSQLEGVLSANASVLAIPLIGNGVIKTVQAVNSGKGYIEDEIVQFYPADTINTITIVDGGTGYSNGDMLIFIGGDPTVHPEITVRTNGSGAITNTVITSVGSGFKQVPTVQVKSRNGNGAILTASIAEFYEEYEVSGKVIKGGIGVRPGYWSTTRGFLNSDKYIQDSYYYQDFSYQINTAISLNKYKELLYNTFHTAGAEMFGEYRKTINEQNLLVDAIQTPPPNTNGIIYITADIDTTVYLTEFLTVDSNTTVDTAYF